MATKELVGSRVIFESYEGRTAERIFLVPWESRLDDAPALGDPYPGDNDLCAVSRKFEPFGNPVGDGESYDEARATIKYSTAEELDLKEWLEASVSFEIAGVGTQWESYKDPVTEEPVVNYQGVPIIIPRMTFVWESERTTLTYRTVYDILGKINSGTFKGHSRKTLLYLGAQVRHRLTSRGGIAYRYTHRAAVKADGWDKFLVPGAPGVTDKLAVCPYDDTSFYPLS